MKDAHASGPHKPRNGRNLRYVLAAVTAFSALITGLGLVRETLAARQYGFFAVELILILAVACLCAWLLVPRFWRKVPLEPMVLDFRPNGEHLYGYEPQVKAFREVLSAAKTEMSQQRTGPPRVLLCGKSGVGKSSFLLHCFPDPRKVIRLDMRQGLTRIVETLETTFGRSPSNTAGVTSIEHWLQTRIADPTVAEQLSETVLILDQFEQVIANEDSLSLSVKLFQTLAPHCHMVIISVRRDVLGGAVDAIREFLPNPMDAARVRMFELLPIQHGDPQEQNLLCGVWRDIMTDSPDPNMPLLTHLGEMLWREEGNRAMLPVFVKLVVYALKVEKIQTVQELESKTGGKIGSMVDRLLHRIVAGTANEELALRILFSLSNDTGVAEEFDVTALQIISSTGASLQEVEEVMAGLLAAGVVSNVGSGQFSLSHECFGELAQRHAQRWLTPAEMEQIRLRQKLVKKSAQPSGPLCDVKERVGLLNYEGLLLVLGILVGISRLFIWSPQSVRVGLEPAADFVPAALGWSGTSVFFWLFYGNVGKAIIPYQGGVGKALWTLTLMVPLAGWATCCFFPREWLTIGCGATVIAALTHLEVSRWAKKLGSQGIAKAFRGYAITTFGLIPIFAVSYFLLSRITDPGSYLHAATAAAVVALAGLLRMGVYTWHGRILRDLLARIDLDIVLLRVGKSWGA